MARLQLMRAFVAIEIADSAVMEGLLAFQRDLRDTRADLKLVERENLHFTVKFLGEVTEAQAADADRRLRGLELPKATISVGGVGAFPSASRPRIIWAGVAGEDGQKIVAIAEPIIESLRGIGEEDSRKFQPHLTLARVRSAANVAGLVELLRASSERAFGTAGVSMFKLKSSILTPKGPIYGDVGVYQLN